MISVREIISPGGEVKVTRNYTVPEANFAQLSMCVGGLTLKTTYEVCVVANISSRVGEEIDCDGSLVRTLEEETIDVSSCAAVTAEDSYRVSLETSSGGK